MTNFILSIFKGVLYLSLIGYAVAGYFIGLMWSLPFAYASSYAVHTGGVIGALTGFITGITVVGYGLALLSINRHLAFISEQIDAGSLRAVPRIDQRVEPSIPLR